MVRVAIGFMRQIGMTHSESMPSACRVTQVVQRVSSRLETYRPINCYVQRNIHA